MLNQNSRLFLQTYLSSAYYSSPRLRKNSTSEQNEKTGDSINLEIGFFLTNNESGSLIGEVWPNFKKVQIESLGLTVWVKSPELSQK